jgi:hypothetical protein
MTLAGKKNCIHILHFSQNESDISSQESAVSSSPSSWFRVWLPPVMDGVLLSRCHVLCTVNLTEWSVVRPSLFRLHFIEEQQ